MNTWRAGRTRSSTSGSEGGPQNPPAENQEGLPGPTLHVCVMAIAGFLDVAVVIDVWSRRAVGWSMRNDLTTPSVTDAPDHRHQPAEP